VRNAKRGGSTITMPSANDVPVVADSVKTQVQFPMVRCNYLSVECDSPKPDWTLSIDRGNLPFLMLGLVGIITRPFDAERFYTVQSIEDLFEQLEDRADLFIDVDDIWLPMLLFDDAGIRPEVGHVYRVTSEMFTTAHSFREGRLDLEIFLERCRILERSLVLSEEEMSAFQQWRETQVRNAIEEYPKNRELELAWHDD
jgi:hypothetical protein